MFLFLWPFYIQNAHKSFQRGSDLRIYNIQPSDAGTYICLVSPDEADLTHVGDEDLSSSDKPFDNSFLEGLTIVLKVRSTPGPVNKLSVRLSTIVGVLMWEFTSNHSGGYPIKSFTADFRKYFDADETNATLQKWHRLDPENIPANVVSQMKQNCLTFWLRKGIKSKIALLQRYYEIFHLIPNTTYEFRLWANNYLGAGEIVITSATTLGQLSDESKWHFDIKTTVSETIQKTNWTHLIRW